MALNPDTKWYDMFIKYVPAQQAMKNKNEDERRALLQEAARQFKEVWPECKCDIGGLVFYMLSET